VGIAAVDSKGKLEGSAFVHACGTTHVKSSVSALDPLPVQYGDDIPSSGEMVKVKLRRSFGSGKSIVIVDGRSSSVMSASSGVFCQPLIVMGQR
jgi:hypothetical protein